MKQQLELFPETESLHFSPQDEQRLAEGRGGCYAFQMVKNGEVITHGFMRLGKRASKRCAFCKQRAGTQLCDYRTPTDTQTCDKPICKDCAAHVSGKDLDFCPDHREAAGFPALKPASDERSMIPIKTRYPGYCQLCGKHLKPQSDALFIPPANGIGGRIVCLDCGSNQEGESYEPI